MKIDDLELQQLLTAIEGRNLSIAQAIALINGKIEEKAITLHVAPIDDIKLTVDYTKTVDQSIVGGKYDWKNKDVTAERFLVSSEMIGKKVDIFGGLFHFNCNTRSKDAISGMDKEGFRPATLMELLALGTVYPELQRQFPIIALGSVGRDSGGHLCVPCLRVGGLGRGLNLYGLAYVWGAQFRFLGVRK